MTNKVTKSMIDALMNRVTVHYTVTSVPTPHVVADAWLDDSFKLASATSKSVDPKEFDYELGREYSKRDVLKMAETKLWELEGYRIFQLNSGNE